MLVLEGGNERGGDVFIWFQLRMQTFPFQPFPQHFRGC